MFSFLCNINIWHSRKGKKVWKFSLYFRESRQFDLSKDHQNCLKKKEEQFRLKGPYQLPSTLERNLPSDPCPPHWLQVDINLSFHVEESNSALFLSFPFLFPHIFLLVLFLPNGKAYIIYFDKKLLSYSFKC